MIRTLLILLVAHSAAASLAQSSFCKHGGQRFVNDYIQFHCTPNDKSNDKLQLEARAIGELSLVNSIASLSRLRSNKHFNGPGHLARSQLYRRALSIFMR